MRRAAPSSAWRCLQHACRCKGRSGQSRVALFDPWGTEENGSSAAGGAPIGIVPSTVIGATDAANYQRICPECIRFSAFVVDDDECDRGVHGTNERITRRAYLQGVRFLIALLHML